MSRVAKMPVTIPAGVDVSVKDDQIAVKGAGGTLSLAQNVLVKVRSSDGKLRFEPANESRQANAMSGTLRQLVNNMVLGVSKGFEKKLSLVGVGVKGADRQRVGQIAAEIRAVRPPEPYKGKGIRYADEKITIKETKKKQGTATCRPRKTSDPAVRASPASALPRTAWRA